MGYVRWLAVLSLVAFNACDNSSSSSSRENTLSPQEEVRSVLEGVANSGQIDSGIIAARNALEKWRTTDAAKAEELLKDLDALERLTGQAAKKKASEMIGNL